MFDFGACENWHLKNEQYKKTNTIFFLMYKNIFIASTLLSKLVYLMTFRIILPGYIPIGGNNTTTGHYNSPIFI